jgi:hypothetical protein
VGLHQICHRFPPFLGQALQTLAHGAIHIDGNIQFRFFAEGLAPDSI